MKININSKNSRMLFLGMDSPKQKGFKYYKSSCAGKLAACFGKAISCSIEGKTYYINAKSFNAYYPAKTKKINLKSLKKNLLNLIHQEKLSDQPISSKKHKEKLSKEGSEKKNPIELLKIGQYMGGLSPQLGGLKEIFNILMVSDPSRDTFSEFFKLTQRNYESLSIEIFPRPSDGSSNRIEDQLRDPGCCYFSSKSSYRTNHILAVSAELVETFFKTPKDGENFTDTHIAILDSLMATMKTSIEQMPKE